MIILKCKLCSKVWYTANTRYTPKCEDCGGELEEQEADLCYLNEKEKDPD